MYACIDQQACKYNKLFLYMTNGKDTPIVGYLWRVVVFFSFASANWQSSCILFCYICNSLSTCNYQSDSETFHKTSLTNQRHCFCVHLEFVECSRSCRCHLVKCIWNEIIENTVIQLKTCRLYHKSAFFFFKLLYHRLRGKNKQYYTL